MQHLHLVVASEAEEPHARTREASGVKCSLADSKETGPQSRNSKELDSAKNLSGTVPQSYQKEMLPRQHLDLGCETLSRELN